MYGGPKKKSATFETAYIEYAGDILPAKH